MNKENKSTFLIKSTADRNKSFGTGFCIHKDAKGSFLLTCAHVVEACGKNDLEIASHKATCLHISKDDDIIDMALLYVEGLTDTIALKLSSEIAQEGDAFDIDGYRPHKSNHANEPLKGYIKKSYTLESQKSKSIIYDLSINEGDSIEQGYSGSAVVSAQTGLVMAVATDRKRDGKNAYATPIKYLTEIWEEIPFELITFSKKNPYKGLNSFEYKDKENYYGREKESEEIAKTLKSTKLFTLLGASGSGKSSLVFAGILPLIKEDGVEVLSFRPQSEPFKNLASLFIPTLYPDKLEQIEQSEKLTKKLMDSDIKLDNLVQTFLTDSKSKHLYLIVDQFEELFTMSKEPKIRNSFLDQLLTLVHSELNVTLLISMRADFLSHLSYYEPFSSAYNAHPSKMLSLLNKQSLQKVIEEPVLKVGVSFQDGLVDRIINEIEDEAGQLPLLEFALDQLWEKKKGRVITHDVLDGMKSISASISHYADSFYERYANKQESIKKVFMKLVTTGCGEEDIRRVAFLDEFDQEERETIVLLANERLVVTQDEKVDIVHEAFIREWKQLSGWIEAYREFLDWEKSVRDDRLVYVTNKEKKEDLLRESKLFRAEEFFGKYKGYIASGDRVFIELSIKNKNRKRRTKWFLVGFVFVFLLGVIFLIWNLKNETDIERIKVEKFSENLVEKIQSLEIDFEMKKQLYMSVINEFKYDDNKKIYKILSRVYNNLGLLYFSEKNATQAIVKYKKAVSIDEKYRRAYTNIAVSYLYLHEYDNAIIASENSINISPTVCNNYSNLLEAYYGKKNFNKIKEIGKKREEHNCTYYKDYLTIGHKAFADGKYFKAIEFAKEAIKENKKKNDYKIFTLLGKSYIKINDFEKAIEAYQHAISIESKKEWLYVYIFGCELVKNNTSNFNKKLEEDFNKLKNRNSNNFKRYEALKVLQKIVKGEKIKIIIDKKGILKDWNHGILEKWIEKMEDAKIKAQLLEVLGVFEGHGRVFSHENTVKTKHE